MAQDAMFHGSVAWAAQGLCVEIGIVEFAVYFAGLNLAKGDLLFDIIDDHQKMLAFLGVGAVLAGDGDNGAVVFHYDGWESDGEAEFLAECDDKVEILCESKDGSGFGLS